MTNDVAGRDECRLCPRKRPSHVMQALDFWQSAARIARSGLAAAIIATITIVPASAADWIEPPYNPAVGSRWIIENTLKTEETKPDNGVQTMMVKGRAEMTIDEKAAEGFRISYVARQIVVEGSSPNVPVIRIYCKMIENILIRATIDVAGKPVRIDNFDAVKADMHKEMDRLQRSGLNSPRELLALSMMMSDLVPMDPERAAPAFLTEMVRLAKSQNTGMKMGDVQHSTEPADNPLGTTLRSKVSFALSSIDVEKKMATYQEVRVFDEASVKDFVFAHSKAMLAKSGDGVTPERMERLVTATTMSLDGKAIFLVENGMTRQVEEASTTMANVAGKVSTKVESKTIKVTPAP